MDRSWIRPAQGPVVLREGVSRSDLIAAHPVRAFRLKEHMTCTLKNARISSRSSCNGYFMDQTLPLLLNGRGKVAVGQHPLQLTLHAYKLKGRDGVITSLFQNRGAERP